MDTAKGTDMATLTNHIRHTGTAGGSGGSGFDGCDGFDGFEGGRTERRARPAHRDGLRRPGPVRPAAQAPRYRGTGVRFSPAAHGRRSERPVTPLTVVVLALLAGVITVWLGVVAQFGQVAQAQSAPVPTRLAVVQVQSGESLQHLAARVAPDSPVGSVVSRIRELNKLDTGAVEAGQTLIAPMA